MRVLHSKTGISDTIEKEYYDKLPSCTYEPHTSCGEFAQLALFHGKTPNKESYMHTGYLRTTI